MTTVLITRPLIQAQKTALRLKSLGFVSHIDPMLTIESLPITLDPESSYQAICLTSAHAVPTLQHIQNPHLIITVGDSTAEAVRKAPGGHSVISARGTSRDLVRLAEKNLRPQDGPLLYISGKEIHFDLEKHFKELSYMIERVIAYKTRAAQDLLRASHRLLRAQNIRYILFYSERTARIFANIIKNNKMEHLLEGVQAFVLSENIKKPLRGLPLIKINVANEPTEAALLDKICGEILGKE